MDDKDLVEALREGSKIAFQHIFVSYYKIVLAYVMKLSREMSIAEDITQHCFMVLWNKRKTLNIHTSLKSYLFSAAHNIYVDTYRKKEKEKSSFEKLQYNEVGDAYSDTHAEEILEENLQYVKQLLDELPPRCKEILLMSKQEGLKYKEIAEKLSISVKTVEAQMYIALKKLREGFKNKSNL